MVFVCPFDHSSVSFNSLGQIVDRGGFSIGQGCVYIVLGVTDLPSSLSLTGSAENPDQNTEDYLFQVILEKTIRIPRSLSVKAASILKGFLNKNPIERLGCDADR